MEDQLKEEEKLSKKEQKMKERREFIKSQYEGSNGSQFLGEDTKTYYVHNPENVDLMIEACDKSGLDIEIKAFSDVYIMDCWFSKPKDFVCQLKRISGKDLTNPLFKDCKLILMVNGDVFYSCSKARRKFHLLKELSRVLYSYEKDKYSLLKFNYQNNNILMDIFGAFPSEEDLKSKLGD